MAALLDEFLGFFTALNEIAVDYALCGGMAMAAHGFMRTHLDIEILASHDGSSTIETIARQRGYRIDPAPSRFLKSKFEFTRYRVFNSNSVEPIGVHVFRANGELLETWNDRKRFSLQDLDLSVVSKDGLLFMMRNSGRAQESIDIENVPASCDMSPAHIFGRLRGMDELWELSMSLVQAGREHRRKKDLVELDFATEADNWF